MKNVLAHVYEKHECLDAYCFEPNLIPRPFIVEDCTDFKVLVFPILLGLKQIIEKVKLVHVVIK